MSKNLRMRILIVLAVFATAVYFTFPLGKRINLGLDLKGGMHLVLKVETEKLNANAKTDAVARAIEILRNRIDGLGVGETVIQRQGEDQIIVQLPGITDREAALRMVGEVAQLEFYLVSDAPYLLKEALAGNVPTGYTVKYVKEDNQPILLEANPSMKGEAVADARVDFNSTAFNEPRISLTFTAKGAKDFAQLTRKHTGERLAIVLDGEVLSAPNIKEPILSGTGEITGSFTFDEASLLSLALRSGSLPAPMRIEEERTIGPLLGKDSINAGITASIIGFILVIVFMAIYYLLPGIVAGTALFMNLFLILGVMGLLKVLLPEAQPTLTLPGIAGLLLTLGMAVDANVLINERIREELKNGQPIQAAIANGYNRAFSAIFDSNFTTIIAGIMLFQFGSGPIKGFAVTLILGLVASLFTALFVTRTIFMFLMELRLVKSLPMLQFFANTKINFISKMPVCVTLSVILIAAGMTAFIQKQNSVYGIDFAGGQIQEYKFKQPVPSEQLREILKNAGVADAVIQRFDKNPENVIIRTSEDTYNTVSAAFKEKLPDNSFDMLRLEKVGPIVGKNLRQRAMMAIILAMGGILIYVGFRFKHFDFATAGVIAILHDVLVTLGCIVMLGRQVDLLVVTALLTIAGYSINDTIVIYDRIRENMAKMRRMSLPEIINVSINQTLSRTILTTLVTFLVVLSLYFWGGEILNTFALCLIIGFLAGTYSTVFIAAPLVVAWEKKK
jgi:SecD/SecF fusion protein